jgi:tRNA-specific 2-thiouridylase
MTTAGEWVGTHAGIGGYTVGQRRGLPGGEAEPRYVTRIDPATNTIVIGREDELDAYGLVADELNLIRPEHFTAEHTEVLAMTRYRARPARATATILEDGTLSLRFTEPQRAITPGQLVALLDLAGEEILGAATIREAA